MMLIEPFIFKTDFNTINEWRMKRNIRHASPVEVPALGFMATKNAEPVAAAFLRQCEGSYGMIDCIITNPQAESNDRHEALDLLFKELIETAKQINLSELIGFSIDVSTLERSKEHGFKESQFKLMTMSLGEIR